MCANFSSMGRSNGDREKVLLFCQIIPIKHVLIRPLFETIHLFEMVRAYQGQQAPIVILTLAADTASFFAEPGRQYTAVSRAPPQKKCPTMHPSHWWEIFLATAQTSTLECCSTASTTPALQIPCRYRDTTTLKTLVNYGCPRWRSGSASRGQPSRFRKPCSPSCSPSRIHHGATKYFYYYYPLIYTPLLLRLLLGSKP